MLIWSGRAPRAVVWLSLVGLMAGAAVSAMIMTRTPGIQVYVAVVPVFVFAVPFIAFVTRRLSGLKSPTAHTRAAHTRGEKPKRAEEDFAALLELLDEDDANELRQRIKQRLIDRIDAGSEQDIESFDELLNNRESQKRR